MLDNIINLIFLVCMKTLSFEIFEAQNLNAGIKKGMEISVLEYFYKSCLLGNF